MHIVQLVAEKRYDQRRNPIGFRGASRYMPMISGSFKNGSSESIKIGRLNNMATNVEVTIPYLDTLSNAQRVVNFLLLNAV